MPRIDPLLLLKTLSVLLGPDGGIKESEDVQRVVNLMIRFSKKLVSKCIYIQILLSTKKHLLDSFYSHGGWELVTGWFRDACERDNWRLLEDMLHLFKDSPVTVERLKMNQSPKQVKHLSKDAKCDVVKELALEVVDIWMKVIKGESGGKDKKRKSVDSEEGEDNNWKMEIRNGICVLKKVDSESAGKKEETGTSPRSDSKESAEDAQEESNDEDVQGEAEAQSTSAEGTGGGVNNLDDQAQQMHDKESIKEEKDKDESEEATHKSPRDKKGTDAKSKREVGKSPRGRKREHSSRSDTRSSKRKSEKSSEKCATSKDKGKSVSSPRHSSKDSSHRHRDHRLKDRESEKLREREKEKEQQRKKQSEKDKETLDMVRGKGISLGRLGAIPKKTAAGSDGKVGETSGAGTKSASASGDVGVLPKKPGVGQGTKPEVRRPTVKTFGAKFRSTGLEDAVSTAALPKKKTADVVRSRPPPVPIPKRPQPDPPSVTTPPDKRLRIEQRPPVERPGGIKVIPPKPLHLQEASGFMDALNAISVETKRKASKRVRRLSSKEDKKEEAPSVTSPVAAKPQMKFYQDTQVEEEKDDEKEKDESEEQSEQPKEPTDKEQKAVDADEVEDMAADESHEADDERAPTPPTIPLERSSDETQHASSPASTPASVRPSGAARQLRGALIYHRPLNRRKLSVRWVPEDTLVHVNYFEMDETERVNVNRAKFLEMQTLEKTKEREFLRRARQTRDDGMSEQMPWQMLIVVDRPPELVVPGVRSQERTHQEERELTSLPAFLNPVMLPDTPSEAEPEFQDQTPCKPIPLEDAQGDANVKDHTGDGWPEPRPEPCSIPPPNSFPMAAGPMPNMAPPSLMGPPNNWGPGGPMQPDGMGGMMGMNADMMPNDMMDVPMGMHGPGPGPGFGGPQAMIPPGGGWGPIGGPPMGPGPMMNGPGPGPAGGMMMGGPGLGPGLGLGLGLGPGPGPGPGPHFGGGGGGYRGRGGGWRSGTGGGRPPFRNYFDIPCRHYNAGHCRKGMACQFMHSAQVRNGSSGRSDTQPSRGGGTGRGRTDSRHWNDRQAPDDFV